MYFKDDSVILVQGPSVLVPKIKEVFEGYNLLFSTWAGEEDNYDSSDIVIYNSFPEHRMPSNFNLQKITTFNGLFACKALGYKRVLKIRSDMYPNNTDEFIKLLENDDLNFLIWHYHCTSIGYNGYLVDYLMSGKIDDMLKLWDIDNCEFNYVSEVVLTDSYIRNLSDVPINFFLNGISKDNDIIWEKKNTKLSEYNTNGFIKDGHDYSYLYLKEHHLNINYGKN